MPSTTAPTFVDTNVLVYARDASEPGKQPIAAEWLRFLWQERAGRLSVQVLSEYFVTVTRKLKPGLDEREAWEDVEALMTWSPWPTDAALLKRAHAIGAQHRIGWWDSLIVAAAQCQDCRLLLSEDLQDGARFGEVEVRNPFVPRATQDVPMYRPAVQSRPLHPPRGRPRKVQAPGL